jgi:hypothetical protein
MTNTLTRTIAGILTAFVLVVGAGAMAAAQAHHSTAHSIGTQTKSSNRASSGSVWRGSPQSTAPRNLCR